MLGLSDRHVRRMAARCKDKGPEALTHQWIGKPSNHQITNDSKERALELIKSKHPDMGPKLASEVLAEREGINICSETLRRELIKHDL
jgi:hypothetical protein